MMRVIVIGVSAGGPLTLKELFSSLKNLPAAVLIAQHNISTQMNSFAEWLSSQIPWEVIVVESEEKLKKGLVYLPSGGKDLILRKEDVVAVKQSKNSISPSIDVLFESAANVLRDRAIGIILGGLGNDGVEGSRRISEVGGRVIVQSDAKFSYLPLSVKKAVGRVCERTLKEIALFIETLL